MPVYGYMQMPDIEGESRSAQHEGQIDVYGIDWDMAQEARMQRGSGLTASRAQVQAIRILKRYDSSSTYLALACMQAKAFDEVVISFRRDSGEAHLDYLKITLGNVVVSSYALTGTEEGA